MTARFPISGCAAVAGYFVAMMAIGVFALKLSSVLATQAIALTEPYFLNDCPCMPSLVEQRLIAEQITAPPTHEATKTKVTALESPSNSIDVLAAQMDLAEKEDHLLQPQAYLARTGRRRLQRARPQQPSKSVFSALRRAAIASTSQSRRMRYVY